MRIKFWGVRGSVPIPGPHTSFFGGNTSCAEVDADEGVLIIVDAGTGIRSLGKDLTRPRDSLLVHLLITHTHWDHLCGYPFFAPLYSPATKVIIHGRGHFGMTLEEIISNQMKYSYFPTRAALLPASVEYDEIETTSFTIESVKVDVMNTNHPVLSLAYRLTHGGKSVVFTGDHEPYYDFVSDDETSTGIFRTEDLQATAEEQNRRVIEFCSGADLIVADAQYTPEEYEEKRGWGHMTYEHAVRLTVEGGASQLALTHHDPDRADDAVKEIENRARELAARISADPPLVFAARENMEVAL